MFKRAGYFTENSETQEDPLYEDNPLWAECVAASIGGRIAMGSRKGQRVERLGSFGKYGHLYSEEARVISDRCVAVNGFSLHAQTSCKAHEREKLEKFCRYISRGAVAEERLQINAEGKIVYRLKKITMMEQRHWFLNPWN